MAQITDDAATHTDLDPVDDEFAVDTVTDIPEVPMADFPVLTDAVDDQDSFGTDTAVNLDVDIDVELVLDGPLAVDDIVAIESTADTPATLARPALDTKVPVPRSQPIWPAAAQSPPLAARPTPAQTAEPATAPLSNSAQRVDEEEELHQTQTMRALASAKTIDDISSSMAETLFGEADLDMLSAALASAGWPDNEKVPVDDSKVPASSEPIVEDELDIFGFSTPGPLELLDDDGQDTKTPDQRKVATRR